MPGLEAIAEETNSQNIPGKDVAIITNFRLTKSNKAFF